MVRGERPRPEGPSRRVPAPGVVAQRVRFLSLAATALGLVLVGLAVASVVVPAHELYRTELSGYAPPFDAAAGILLIVLAPRIRERTPVAWLFSLLAPVLTCTIAGFSPDPYALASGAASAAYVVAIFPFRSGFYRGTTAPRTLELALAVAGLLTLLFGTVGSRWLGGQFSPPVDGWAQALYFTVSTISTNGSAINPTTDAARLFVVALILLGVGTFLSAVVVFFLPFVERRLTGLASRLERSQMQELERHVIVCGASPEAHATARALREAGARPVILAADSQALELLRSEGFRTHLGDPSVEDDLKIVGIERARAVVVAQASDAENLLTVITARALQPSLRIVAIASSDSSLPKLRRAGANEAVSVVRVAAQLMSSAALEPNDVDRSHPHSITP